LIDKGWKAAFTVLVASFALIQPAHALGIPSIVNFEASRPGSVALVNVGRAAPIYVDPADHGGVLRAAADLQATSKRSGAYGRC
jgi:hypothetical protein